MKQHPFKKIVHQINKDLSTLQFRLICYQRLLCPNNVHMSRNVQFYTLRKKGSKVVTGAVPFQKVIFLSIS